MTKIGWMAAGLAVLTLGACAKDTGTAPDLICPTTLITDPGGSWWITNSVFGGDVQQITLNATFRLADLGASAVFSSNGGDTYQLWATPGTIDASGEVNVLEPPVAVVTSPAGLNGERRSTIQLPASGKRFRAAFDRDRPRLPTVLQQFRQLGSGKGGTGRG